MNSVVCANDMCMAWLTRSLCLHYELRQIHDFAVINCREHDDAHPVAEQRARSACSHGFIADISAAAAAAAKSQGGQCRRS